jgi:hypothetical protein
MRSISLLFPCFALVSVLLACNDDSGGEPAVVNHGLAALRVHGSGDLRLVGLSEAAEERDFTRDGDREDEVLAVLDADRGLLTTGLALAPEFLRDEVPPVLVDASDAIGVFVVDEARTGNDANGNGTPDEITTWIFDRRTGDLFDLGFVHQRLELGGPLAAFLTLGGDVVVYDSRRRSLTTHAVPAPGSAVLLLVAGEFVAFQRSELEEDADLNLDGDADDPLVLFLHDARTRRLVSTRWAAGAVVAAGERLAMNVLEASQGEEDLDGDGDADDRVLVVLDPATLRTTVPVLAGGLLGIGAVDAEWKAASIAEDAGDLNGDGDELDYVLVLHEPASGRLLETELADGSRQLPAGRWIVFEVDEFQSGADLDGDGQALSHVLHAIDRETGEIVNLGFASTSFVGLDDHLLALRSEATADWNGDGDRSDFVLFHWDGLTRELLNTELTAVIGPFGASGLRALLIRIEDVASGDLNDDGDLLDPVLALYDAGRRSVENLGLAATGFGTSVGPRGFGAALASEQAQGVDLNGDGDLFDEVLHSLRISP